MNLYTKFHRNVSNSPFHTNPQMWNSWWPYRKSQRITKASRIHPPNFMTLHPIVVEIFRSGPKWWADRTTVHQTGAMSRVWLKTQLNMASHCSWDRWHYLSWSLVVIERQYTSQHPSFPGVQQSELANVRASHGRLSLLTELKEMLIC